MIPEEKKLALVSGLRQVLNADGIDNDLGTPDIFLAAYLFDCLQAFERANRLRAEWFGNVSPSRELRHHLGLDDPRELRG